MDKILIAFIIAMIVAASYDKAHPDHQISDSISYSEVSRQ
jgi:hypothetical protein